VRPNKNTWKEIAKEDSEKDDDPGLPKKKIAPPIQTTRRISIKLWVGVRS